jgi:hypothetical protein
MQTSSERRPATTKSHAHVGTPRRSASGVTDRIAGVLASASRAAVSSLSAAHAGAVGHVACDHVVTLLMFARWCECHGTTTPAMRSTGRAITLVSQTLGHADPKTTSVLRKLQPIFLEGVMLNHSRLTPRVRSARSATSRPVLAAGVFPRPPHRNAGVRPPPVPPIAPVSASEARHRRAEDGHS